jgi:hypothetical protein
MQTELGRAELFAVLEAGLGEDVTITRSYGRVEPRRCKQIYPIPSDMRKKCRCTYCVWFGAVESLPSEVCALS